MKKTIAMVLHAGAGAATGYIITKRRNRKVSRKKVLLPVLTGALTGGIAGMLATRLSSKANEEEHIFSLQPKGNISIQRSN